MIDIPRGWILSLPDFFFYPTFCWCEDNFVGVILPRNTSIVMMMVVIVVVIVGGVKFLVFFFMFFPSSFL